MSIKKSITQLCGRFNFDPVTKKVTKQSEVGALNLILNDQNELIMRWRNEHDVVQFERYLFKGDSVMEKVKGQGRTFLVKCIEDGDKYFFWFSGQDVAFDEKFCLAFNTIISNQNLESQQILVSSVSGGAMELEQVPQQQNTAQSAPQSTQPAVQQPLLTQLQQMMSGFIQRPKRIESNYQVYTLGEILTNDFLKSIANDEDYLQALLLHLPDGQKDPEQILDNLLSPQFQQALDQLTQALHNHERRGVLQQLELNPAILEQEFDGVIAFLRAIINKVREEQQ